MRVVNLFEASWKSTRKFVKISIKLQPNKAGSGQIDHDKCGEIILSGKGERNFRKFLVIQYWLCRNSLEVKVRPGWDFGKLKETPRSFKVFTTAPTFYQSCSRVIILPLLSGELRLVILLVSRQDSLSSILGRMFLKFHLFLAFTPFTTFTNVESLQTVSVNLSGKLV